MPSDTKARKLAERALADDNTEIRLAAATALGEMQARASIPKLKKALNDDDPLVVLAAAHSLELMHNPAAYEIYSEVLVGDRKGRRGLLASEKSALKDPKEDCATRGEGNPPFHPLRQHGLGSCEDDVEG